MEDGGVVRVREGTGAPVAEAGEVELVPAEGLRVGPVERRVLDLEGTVSLVDDVPHDIVYLHVER